MVRAKYSLAQLKRKNFGWERDNELPANSAGAIAYRRFGEIWCKNLFGTNSSTGGELEDLCNNMAINFLVLAKLVTNKKCNR